MLDQIMLLLAALIIGVLFGIITGLTPGVHINLVSAVLLSVSPALLLYTSAVSLAVFIISMSITHTFLDAVPSIYLGAPDEAQALGALPGHRMLLKGQGYAAVYLTVVGSFFGLLLAILLIPFLLKAFSFLYPIIRQYIAYFLIVIILYMILKDKFRLWALFLFFLSGTLGIIVFSMPNIKEPLFPMLSGLFGVSTLLLSYFEKVKIPEQKTEKPEIKAGVAAQAIASSTFAGTLISFLPGLGPAQGAVVAQSMTRKIGDAGFLVLIGGINTVGMIISLVTLFAIDKARNGSVIAISKLISFGFWEFMLLVLASLIAGVICIFLTLFVAKRFSAMITRINYRLLIIIIIFFVAFMSLAISGLTGFLILLVASSIGLIAPLKGVSRSHAMGCLILPVIFYFIL